MRKPDSPALFLILALYLALGFSTVLTRSPWQDEAWFGNPAWNLAHHGFLGTTVLDPASSTWKSVRLTGIDRHTYWVMPLSLLLNSAVFRVFGFGSLPMRIPSSCSASSSSSPGAPSSGASTPRPPAVTALALLLIAVDFHYETQAADGRMDAMTAALGYSAIAAWLVLRKRSILAAAAVSNTLAAAAFFTHPNGILPILLLAITALTLDRRRSPPPSLPSPPSPTWSSPPRGVSTSCRRPPIQAQFFGNIAGRRTTSRSLSPP